MMLWMIIAYSLVALVITRPLIGHFAYTFAANSARDWPSISPPGRADNPSSDNWFCGSVVGCVCALLWPATFVWYLMAHLSSPIGAEAAAIRRQQAARIIELEKELDIR